MKTFCLIISLAITVLDLILAKSNQIKRITPLSPNKSPVFDLLRPQGSAIDAANQAVSAFSEAVATCEVNVSCDEAKRRYGKTEIFVKTASQAFSKSVAAANDANGSIINKSILDASMSKEVAELAAKQSALALQATATALASCEVIVNLVCEQCPGGIEPSRTQTSRAAKIISDIKDRIKGMF